MRALVPDEMGALAEGLPAVLAHVRLGPGVGPQVLGDRGAVIERPATLLTFERLLSSVSPDVLCERGALDKSFPTILTHIRLLSGVDFLVYGKVSRVPEYISTGTASAHLASFTNPGEGDLVRAPDFFAFTGLLRSVALWLNFDDRSLCHIANR